MDNQKITNIVNALLDKAVAAKDSGDAMRLTQAATNAASSYCALAVVTKADSN